MAYLSPLLWSSNHQGPSQLLYNALNQAVRFPDRSNTSGRAAQKAVGSFNKRRRPLGWKKLFGNIDSLDPGADNRKGFHRSTLLDGVLIVFFRRRQSREIWRELWRQAARVSEIVAKEFGKRRRRVRRQRAGEVKTLVIRREV